MGQDWSANDGFIERIDFDGSNRQVVVPKGATFTPKQMQVDAAAGLLYWCDREGMRVMRSRPTAATSRYWSRRVPPRRIAPTSVGIVSASRSIVMATGFSGRRRVRRTVARGESSVPRWRCPRACRRPAGPTSPSSSTICPSPSTWNGRTTTLYWTDRGDPPQGNTLNRCRFAGGTPGSRRSSFRACRKVSASHWTSAHDQAFVSDLGGNLQIASLGGAARHASSVPGWVR